jgi:hypothetical protein
MKQFSCHHKNCSKRYTTPYTLRRHVRLKHMVKSCITTLPNSPDTNSATVPNRGTWTSLESGIQTLQLALQELTRSLN